MFNQMRPGEVVALLGDVLREAERWDRPLDEFHASQLLSASSVARYLAAELQDGDAELRRFTGQVMAALADAAGTAVDGGWRAELAGSSRALADPGADPAGALGRVLTRVLRAAAASTDPGAARFRSTVHRMLAELVDREVALLGGATTRQGGR